MRHQPATSQLRCLGTALVSRWDHTDPTQGELADQDPRGEAHQEESVGD